MSHQSELISTDIDAYLAQHERKELLRILTCGSVDDGKSTLIGRLLHDSKLLYQDQIDSIRDTSDGESDLNLARVTDGLKAEQEQGITIDVAYRYFSTARRKFIIADTPGHEQYTRNMATGASTCNLAIILIDARNGVMTQTRRHSFITQLLGIRHFIVAINKMDLVDYSRDTFDDIRDEFANFSARLEMKDVRFIPVSALKGDNVVDPGDAMPWYTGSTLMHVLEHVYIASDRNLIDMRLPIQYVNRPDDTYRGYCGTLASGTLRPGTDVCVLPGGQKSRVASIRSPDGVCELAHAPMPVSVTLEDEIDISRGNMLVPIENQPTVASAFEAMLVWMSADPLQAGRQYIIKHTTHSVPGSISDVRYRIDVNSLSREKAGTLELNEIGRVRVQANEPLIFDPYLKNRTTGAFIIIDRMSNATVGAGMIVDRKVQSGTPAHWDTPPSSDRLTPHDSMVDSTERQDRFGQKPATILFTGLSGSGKSSLAYALERRLFERGHASTVLDGQNMRLGISRDLGFTPTDRSENLRRSMEIARIINQSGLFCLCALVAPDATARQKAADFIGSDRFIEVHMNAPLDACRERDETGLYEAAEKEEFSHIPGLNFPYEDPEAPDLQFNTGSLSIDDCVSGVLDLLEARGLLD